MRQESKLDRFLDNMDYPLYIVTVAAKDETGPSSRSGCLVGFATQCSADPPRFLVCISKINHSYELMSYARLLAVHIIDSDQRQLSELFGGETGDTLDKFAECQWHPGPDGVPLLDGVKRKMVAEVLNRIDFGDHLGLVLSPLEIFAANSVRPMEPSDLADMKPGHPL